MPPAKCKGSDMESIIDISLKNRATKGRQEGFAKVALPWTLTFILMAFGAWTEYRRIDLQEANIQLEARLSAAQKMTEQRESYIEKIDSEFHKFTSTLTLINETNTRHGVSKRDRDDLLKNLRDQFLLVDSLKSALGNDSTVSPLLDKYQSSLAHTRKVVLGITDPGQLGSVLIAANNLNDQKGDMLKGLRDMTLEPQS
jgi:hypothetical protein